MGLSGSGYLRGESSTLRGERERESPLPILVRGLTPCTGREFLNLSLPLRRRSEPDAGYGSPKESWRGTEAISGYEAEPFRAEAGRYFLFSCHRRQEKSRGGAATTR